MKKVLIFLIVSMMVIPNVVSAAWWNPISWFRKTDTKIEVVESKVNVATSTEPSRTASSSKNIKVDEPKREPKSRVESNVDNSLIIQAEVQRKLQAVLKENEETAQRKEEFERQARIEAIKKQQAIDIANEEARDAQLRIDAQVEAQAQQRELQIQSKLDERKQEAQRKLGEENKLVAEINSQIDSYIQYLNIRISGLKSGGSPASNSTTATGCQGIKTGNGCIVIPNNSYSIDVNGNIRAQLAQRRNELVVIQGKLNEKGVGGITENDKKFLNSFGISW